VYRIFVRANPSPMQFESGAFSVGVGFALGFGFAVSRACARAIALCKFYPLCEKTLIAQGLKLKS